MSFIAAPPPRYLERKPSLRLFPALCDRSKKKNRPAAEHSVAGQ